MTFLAELVSDCMHPDPFLRPTAFVARDRVRQFIRETTPAASAAVVVPPVTPQRQVRGEVAGGSDDEDEGKHDAADHGYGHVDVDVDVDADAADGHGNHHHEVLLQQLLQPRQPTADVSTGNADPGGGQGQPTPPPSLRIVRHGLSAYPGRSGEKTDTPDDGGGCARLVPTTPGVTSPGRTVSAICVDCTAEDSNGVGGRSDDGDDDDGGGGDANDQHADDVAVVGVSRVVVAAVA